MVAQISVSAAVAFRCSPRQGRFLPAPRPSDGPFMRGDASASARGRRLEIS